jgi:hypothetical protein
LKEREEKRKRNRRRESAKRETEPPDYSTAEKGCLPN